MDRRELLQGLAGVLATTGFEINAETMDMDKPYILVLKVPPSVSTIGLERIDEKLTEWKARNNINVPHLVLLKDMTLELVRKPDEDQ